MIPSTVCFFYKYGFVHLNADIFLHSKSVTFTSGLPLIHKKAKMLYYNIKKRLIDMIKRYEFLLADLDNTILDFTAAEHKAVERLLLHYGARADAETVNAYSAFNVSLWERLERKEITRKRLRDTRFCDFFRLYGIEGDGTEAAALYEQYLSENAFWIDGAQELIQRCKGKIKFYIISNGMARVQFPRLEASGLDKAADGHFISERVGYNKPDKRFFDFVFSSIPCFDPEKALVLGDSITADMSGGIACGIDTCLFDRRGKFHAGRIKPMYIIDELYKIYSILHI